MNPLFTSLYNTIVINTNRPNLRAETISAIKSATLELHAIASFIRDVKTAWLSSTSGTSTSFLFAIPNPRAVRRIVNVAPADPNGLCGTPIQEIDLFNAGPDGNWFKWDKRNLEIHVTYPCPAFILSFLSFPNTTEEEYDSWIGEVYPNFVTDLATQKVLAMISKLQQSRLYAAQVGAARLPGTHIFNLLQENKTVD